MKKAFLRISDVFVVFYRGKHSKIVISDNSCLNRANGQSPNLKAEMIKIKSSSRARRKQCEE